MSLRAGLAGTRRPQCSVRKWLKPVLAPGSGGVWMGPAWLQPCAPDGSLMALAGTPPSPRAFWLLSCSPGAWPVPAGSR